MARKFTSEEIDYLHMLAANKQALEKVLDLVMEPFSTSLLTLDMRSDSAELFRIKHEYDAVKRYKALLLSAVEKTSKSE